MHLSHRSNIRQLILLLAVCLGTFVSGFLTDSATVAEDKRPNILMILVDDLGYGDLSCYGAKDLQTPVVDKLASQGMRFSHFYANCPVCSPTRASLMSGRFPELAGVPGVIRTRPEDSWGYFDPEVPTIADVLKAGGYKTAIIGKWHLGLESPNTPNERGFDEFHGYLGDMMDDYYTHRRHGINYMRKNDQEIDPDGHATDLFATWASDYLKAQAKSEQPFFLYLAFNAPHTPIQPPKDWLAKVKAREKGITDHRAKLVALIEHMDDAIGKVLATLAETGLDQETLIVFSSDNGGQLDAGANNGALRDGKQSMYEGGLRVPTCVVWPGKIQAETSSDKMLMTMDLYPTFCEVAGVKVDHAIDGISFLPLLTTGEQDLPERPLYFHRREGNARYQGLTIQAVRLGDWKLLQNSPFAPLELYNLADDPEEKTDLAGKDRRTFNELATLLRRHIQRGGAVPWQPPARKELEK